MSYNLAFWKYADSGLHDDGAVYDSLLNGDDIHFVDPLPTETINLKILNLFEPLMSNEGGAWSSANGSFIVEIKIKYVLFVCTHDTNTIYFNMMIDLMKKFDCPLFDPQVDKRFEL